MFSGLDMLNLRPEACRCRRCCLLGIIGLLITDLNRRLLINRAPAHQGCLLFAGCTGSLAGMLPPATHLALGWETPTAPAEISRVNQRPSDFFTRQAQRAIVSCWLGCESQCSSTPLRCSSLGSLLGRRWQSIHQVLGRSTNKIAVWWYRAYSQVLLADVAKPILGVDFFCNNLYKKRLGDSVYQSFPWGTLGYPSKIKYFLWISSNQHQLLFQSCYLLKMCHSIMV